MIDFSIKATSLFGGGGVDSFFSGSAGGGATQAQQSAQAIVTSQQREINRIKGYKAQLTPADNQRLGELQGKILRIQEKVNNGTVRADELTDRVELYKEADRILGKPVVDKVDTTKDATYIKFVSALEGLMAKKLSPAVQKRVDSLQNIKDNVEKQLTDRPDSPILRNRFQTLDKTIKALAPLRSVSELSVTERKLYDEIVSDLNAYVGIKLQLPSHEAIRVRQLEQSIQQMSANLPADPASQPTNNSMRRVISRVV